MKSRIEDGIEELIYIGCPPELPRTRLMIWALRKHPIAPPVHPAQKLTKRKRLTMIANPLKLLVGRARVELATNGLKVRCSTKLS